jgi:hypothetical protein
MAAVFCMLLVSNVFAQFQPSAQPAVDVSDNVLQKVATAIVGIEKLDQKTEEDILQLKTEKGLTEERFTEIQQAQVKAEDHSAFTTEEMEAYQEIWVKGNEMKLNAQHKKPFLIEKAGLTVEQYEQVLGVLQHSPDLKKKLDDFVSKAR